MKRFFLTAVLVGSAAAESPRFAAANERFHAGDIAGAAALYQEVIGSEGPSAAALFNLGNCEQRLGRQGPAILAYERARLLTPRDPDLLANLALARKAAAVFEEPGRYPRVDAFFAYLSLNEWSWLVAGSAVFLGCLAVLRAVIRLPRRAVRVAVAIAALALGAGGAALWLRRAEGNRAVVLTDSATVRLSPFEKADSLGTPGPGRIVMILETKPGFYFIEVPGTTLRGWMSVKDVSAIQPAGPET